MNKDSIIWICLKQYYNMLAKYYISLVSEIFLQFFCDTTAMLFCKIQIELYVFSWKKETQPQVMHLPTFLANFKYNIACEVSE